MSDQQDKILRLFIEEAKEHLDTLEHGLVDLQATVDDPESVNEMFRAAHSVKGGAAMLGLDSLQKIGHRLEDCLKILKEHPVQTDQTVETLFLKGFDALKELLERLQTPFGLRNEEGNQLVQKIMPVFAQLETHLEKLVNGETPATAAAGGGIPANFAAQVMAELKQMLQGFKQPDSPAARKQLLTPCDRLLQLGASVPKWEVLVKTAKAAISNPKNSYQVLARQIITELKESSELVQAGKAATVAPSKTLQQLAVTPAGKPAAAKAAATTKPAATKPAAAKATATTKQITIPAEPKAVVKALLQTFDKKQLSEIAKLLVQAIKSPS